MTLREKAGLCTGATPWQTLTVERLGLKHITVSDGPHGVRRAVDPSQMINESYPATCFPVAATIVSSWDTELLEEMGQALADECIALDVDILLGPGNNIKRTPLCGRNFEYFSEDPTLAGEMAASLIRGIQSKGVGTSLKHFAVNNQETRRFTINAEVDERALHEIYLRGFEIAVKKGNPWTLMCAYNRVNGDYCSEHRYLLTNVLREQWGYEGFVMSDWGAVHDRVAAVKAGLELQMPGPAAHSVQAVIDAVETGELDEAILDQAVERLLKIILRAQETPKGTGSFDIEKHHALARRIASESMVLLKNDDNLLPLSGEETIAVIGTASQTPVFQGGGSSHINTTKVDSPWDMLKERAEVRYASGDSVTETVSQGEIEEAVVVAKDADVALLFIALPASIESEGYDRPNIHLTAQQEALILAVAQANPRTVVILNNGSAIDMRAWIDSVPAVLEAWLPGQAGAGAIIDILYGDVNPSGKLGETFPLKLSDTPAHFNFPGDDKEVRYGEGIYVGYRAYDEQERQVLFPFGYGLSYTQFEYSHLQLSSSSFALDETLQVSVDVTNTGKHAGKEIVQLYVHDAESRLKRPAKELKAFAKVALQPGETKTVTMKLDDRAFSYYDPAYGQWLVEAGDFDILVGRSSVELHLSAQVHIAEGTPLPSILNKESTLSDWMQDPRGEKIVQPMLDDMFGDDSSDTLGMDSMTFFQDLPLTVLIGFSGEANEKSPDEQVEDLLEDLNNDRTPVAGD
ncbi:glycoside hydrolase family 3 C-terminal domain-containing protein [Phototrophicus methaneseepsis]|uniref:Glycoside hydrolase family 3 C-terminal domain-containing protein n=2 Tax=Phototrophicus methaneseepsis TaxID=2710758 RepID=A0A7S8IGW4_9CHLR|nr:glycoside hydrolase family 3 C-terminal domain-containing protein [Phototrophicus methaneseepsis]